jgi:hydroxyacylglutathione hydrolase
VIHTPGHTPGSTCFLLPASGPIVFSGDTLFRRSVGRTDLWGGDTDTILASIREKLFPLAPETRVVCGHGPDTTIGEERRSNPFASV